MNRTAWPLALALALSTLAFGASAQTQPTQTPPTRTPIPLEAMVREPAMSQMQLSPDGTHLAAITSLDGVERSISIWRTDALNVDPVRLGVSGASARSHVRFSSITWVSNDRILVLMTQPVDVGAGAEARIYTGLARIVDLNGSNWVQPLAEGGPRNESQQFADKFLNIELLALLPHDPQHVLMLQQTPDGAFVYKVNIYNGSGVRLARLGEDEVVLPIVDNDGDIRVKEFVRFDSGNWTVGHEIFNKTANAWEEHPLLSYAVGTRRRLSVQGFDPANPDILIVIDDNNQNFTYARGYSISQRQFVEDVMFQDPRHDITDVIVDHPGGVPSAVIGFHYTSDYDHAYFTDPAARALYEGLERQFPDRHLSVGPRNGRYRVIVAQSSREPPAYFLLTDDRQLTPLGVSVPNIPSDRLAPTQFIHYPARDGLSIPAFLTLPFGWRPGDPPVPVIIQPHGGPWSHNDADWGGGDIPVTQFFASRGFAVLQPQFRGSTGFGAALWKAGDNQWGQAMQDDNDDALAWLAQQHIGDPSRAVIYGFSYGGFAAMAATVRPHSPFRCAISGAGVSSLERIGLLWRDNPIQRQAQGVTVGGMDPLAHAEDANIPILIYVGDRDQTAPIWHSQRFDAALSGHNKPHQFVVIPDMPHGAMTPPQRQQELDIVEAYIKGPCGIAY